MAYFTNSNSACASKCGATSVGIDGLKIILFQDYTQGNLKILMNATDLNNSIFVHLF